MKTKIKLSKLLEHLIVEGKHWPEDYQKTAFNTIKKSPLGQFTWYTDDLIQKDIETITHEFEPLSHKNSNLGYFATIIRWFVEFSGSNPTKYQEFFSRKLDPIIRDLLWLSNSPAEESKVKEQLKTKWKFADFEKYQKEVIDQKRNVDLELKTSKVKYKVYPIKSYAQLNGWFGGEATGYNGNSEWCHTNGMSTYNNWVQEGNNMFFILAREDWEKVRPPQELSPYYKNAYDEYGLSLIALLVEVKSGELLNATLRWNHIISPSDTVPGTSVDNAFANWDQIKQVAGFDVFATVKETLDKIAAEKQYKREHANEHLAEVLKNAVDDKGFLMKNAIISNGFDYNYAKFITKLVIPESVKFILAETFTSFSELKEIKFPSTLTYIAEYAFAYCYKLETVEFPADFGAVGDHAFFSCENLKTIKFNNKLGGIGKGAFSRCSSIESIEFPDSLEIISEKAFYDCVSLKEIKFGPKVKELGYSAFAGCTYLKSVNIPDSVTKMGEAVFYSCTHLEQAKFPKGMNMIPGNTFCNCELLETIVIPDTIEEIGAFAFDKCINLKPFTFSKNIKSIHDNAFFQCQQFTYLDLSNTSCEKIGRATFKFCQNIETVILPKTVRKLEFGAFQKCDKLKSIVLPDTLEEIGSNAFYDCVNVDMTIPPNVKKIGHSSFFRCHNLKTDVILNEVENIPNDAFFACHSIKYVKIGDKAGYIGNDSFSLCKSLEKIDLGNSIKNIYPSAFEGCIKLKEMILPDSVEYIATNAFKNCESLKKLHIPNGIRDVRAYTLEGCPEDMTYFATGHALNVYFMKPQRSENKKNESMKIPFCDFKEMILERK